MDLREIMAGERMVLKRSAENFDKEWSWLFDGLPMRHRARIESFSGINWLRVSFVDGHRKSWSTEKYLVRDMLLHPDDYRVAVGIQCDHARAEMQRAATAAKKAKRGRK